MGAHADAPVLQGPPGDLAVAREIRPQVLVARPTAPPVTPVAKVRRGLESVAPAFHVAPGEKWDEEGPVEGAPAAGPRPPVPFDPVPGGAVGRVRVTGVADAADGLRPRRQGPQAPDTPLADVAQGTRHTLVVPVVRDDAVRPPARLDDPVLRPDPDGVPRGAGDDVRLDVDEATVALRQAARETALQVVETPVVLPGAGRPTRPTVVVTPATAVAGVAAVDHPPGPLEEALGLQADLAAAGVAAPTREASTDSPGVGGRPVARPAPPSFAEVGVDAVHVNPARGPGEVRRPTAGRVAETAPVLLIDAGAPLAPRPRRLVPSRLPPCAKAIPGAAHVVATRNVETVVGVGNGTVGHLAGVAPPRRVDQVEVDVTPSRADALFTVHDAPLVVDAWRPVVPDVVATFGKAGRRPSVALVHHTLDSRGKVFVCGET